MRPLVSLCIIACFWTTAAAQDNAFKDALRLYQGGSLDPARRVLLTAIKNHPTALDYSLLGSIEYQQALLPAAVQHLDKALELEPGLPGTRATLASGLATLAQQDLAAKRPGSAAPLLERAHKLAPADLNLSLALARARNLIGNSEGALALLIAAKRAAPENPAVLYDLGALCLQMDLDKDALDNLTRAVALQPSDSRIRYALGSAQIANHDLPAAIQTYRQLLDADPNNAQLSYALGSTYFLAGNMDLAAGNLETSVHLQPEQVESYYYLALIAQQNGDNQKSVDLLQKIISRRPDHARAHLALGMTERSAGHLEDAVRELRCAARLAPASQKAHYQLALVLTALKQPAQAKSEFDAASRLRAANDDKVTWQLAQPAL